ncbi:UdgX family uracil-DNA binding protein [Altericroceibacterium endophyticum]|uniref:Type-4 uracil-DNA glycosylase n=1 Tax=Altericroceibacterium endophyticum TaxID=1808508 RepID=A0A6I4T338_9SPHN|nr:UdgX family uracil-DNA binding protein [Altericroceibacterium endophyticum]MXO64639.1 UdgX family uracil-DNA binding protein [Altericroceibacterium endophyticum]
MSGSQVTDKIEYHRVVIHDLQDFDHWRDLARQAIQSDISPERISWEENGATGDLFGSVATRLPSPTSNRPVRANKRYMDLARRAFLHSDPRRFGTLYKVLWRLQSEPRLMEDRTDGDIRMMDEWARHVRRDIHKMRAFLRFRVVDEAQGENRFVAWFEPSHHIVRANARFFVERFAAMNWSILTPGGSLLWDGQMLQEGPPARREDAPQGDAAEDLWRSYYASIFNPSRLKIGAMLREMPRKYWKNMPEAALIPDLIAGAQAREARMVTEGAGRVGKRPDTLTGIAEGIAACRDCPIGGLGTCAVMGEGNQNAVLMIVGEQPGDQEEMAGRPFIGPAGQLLNEYLREAGIVREKAYCTNAVKHFKFAQRGKRRIHQTPTAKEVDACRWWLESERALIRPKISVALGASAARSFLGRTVNVARERSQALTLDDGSELWITTHPSYLLRLDGAAKAEQRRAFAHDLSVIAGRIAALCHAV